MKMVTDSRGLDEVIDVLRKDGVIIYPTETVYGIGCLADREAAIDRIAAIKGSSQEASYLVLINEAADLERFCSRIPPAAEKLHKRFWPGALTLVLPAKPGLHPRLIGHTGGVGIRQSSHPWVKNLMKQLPEGLVSTSANPTGCSAPGKMETLDPKLAAEVDIIVDAGQLAGGVSTVLDLCGDEPRIVREGLITVEDIYLKTGLRVAL